MMRRARIRIAGLVLLCGTACGNDGVTDPFGNGEGDGDTGGTSAAPADGSTTDSGDTGGVDADSTGDDAEPPKLDVAGMPDVGSGPGFDACHGSAGEMGGIPCREQAPADSFAPEVQWTWGSGTEGDPDQKNIPSTPLVANLTDDNGDGAIDLCDVPDVVVAAYGPNDQGYSGHLYVLDGATGALHFQIPDMIATSVTPAIGDIDGDGLPEIVAQLPYVFEEGEPLVAFEHDGTIKWIGDQGYGGLGVALADLDNDGDVEILFGAAVIDHEGNTVWYDASAEEASISAYAWGALMSTAADLDGDGDLEVVVGDRAYQHDGSIYFDAHVGLGSPSVANLDDDPQPEIFISGMGGTGLSILEHDGTVKYDTVDPIGDVWWWSPAAVHDIDGDGAPEILLSSQDRYHALRPDLTFLWTADILDSSGLAAGTAFDFLGDAQAEAIYADESQLFVFDEGGQAVFTEPRKSWTGVEFPVVADVDNDGSAEIVVVSNRAWGGQPTHTPVTVFRDADDRWIPARRIWNQHTYHVTNVNEDGTIPQFEAPSWTVLNTFRTNAQIEAGSVCNPQPEG